MEYFDLMKFADDGGLPPSMRAVLPQFAPPPPSQKQPAVDSSWKDLIESAMFYHFPRQRAAEFADSPAIVNFDPGTSPNLLFFRIQRKSFFFDVDITKEKNGINVAIDFVGDIHPELLEDGMPEFEHVNNGTFNHPEQICKFINESTLKFQTSNPDRFVPEQEDNFASAVFDLMKTADDAGYYGRRKAPYQGPARYFGPKKLVIVNGNAVIIGDTMKIGPQLTTMGFAWNGNLQLSGMQGGPEVINGARVKTGPVPPEMLPQLQQLGVDVSTPEMALQMGAPTIAPQPTDPGAAQPQQQPTGPVPTPQDRDVAERLKRAKTFQDASDAVETSISSLIEMLNDPARRKEGEEKAMRYANFASKMWNYSIMNRIMILCQHPDAEHVGGARNFWGNVGRTINPNEAPITILAPAFATKRMSGQDYAKYKEKANQVRQQMQGKSDVEINRAVDNLKPKTLIGFKGVPVYDIKQTSIDPNWRDPKTGEPAFDMETFHRWTMPSKDENQYIEALSQAAERGIASDGIKIVSVELPGAVGGVSRGGQIDMPTSAKGAFKFRSLVHEWAHEFLLKEFREQVKRRERSGRQSKEEYALDEVDADGAAFVVMKSFGVDEGPQAVANYLLGWTKGDATKVRIRQQNIDKAVKHIVQAIRSNIQVDEPQAQQPTQQPQTQISAPATWSNPEMSVPRFASVMYFDLTDDMIGR